MKGVARISFEGGGPTLSTRTQYERQLLIEHVELSAKGRGPIDRAVDGRQWMVNARSSCSEVRASCDRWPDKLTFRSQGYTLCGRCARRVLQ